MRIFVNTNKLTDSPYNGPSDDHFVFDQENIDELVQDIQNGAPTCYLVSGYRGAGKSSFIKKVEYDIKVNNKIIFVHTSFAKYQSKNYLLRKLIRGLYQNLSNEANVKSYSSLKADEESIEKEKRTSVLLETLYEKTFHETVDNLVDQNKKEKQTKIEVNVILFIIFTLTFSLSLSNIIYQWLDNNAIPTIIALLGSLIGAIKTFVDYKTTWTSTTTFSREFQRKSLYDDEIADYHFYNLLDGLKKNGFKVVFVLDELDKVREDEVESLINEMKPYLVSGKATFIVVAGQELYFKHRSSESIDDAILGTLFSRVIHVPLLPIAGFRELFVELVDLKKSKLDNASGLGGYVDYLIFKSKRVPRKFINLIRQEMFWEKNQAFLEINLDKSEFETYSKVVNAIQKIDDQDISVRFYDGTRDYFTMKLFLMGDKILEMDWKDYTFTLDELLKEDE